MNVSTEKIENQQVVLTITAPAEELTKAYEVAYKKIAQKVNIPGFRKGKAPKIIVERHVGKDYIVEEAFDAVSRKAFTEALKETELQPVSQVNLEQVTVEMGQDVVFKTTFTAKPEVQLGEYKGVQVPKFDASVSDDDVQAQLDKMVERQADMVEAEEGAGVEKGNFITLDFKGTVDGVAFAGGEGKDYPLEVGSGSFIPGFEDQLVGMKLGEEKDVNVTFPEEYHSEELKGKAAVFACKINSIKRKVLPAVDDELAKKVSTFETIDALKEDIRKNLQQNADRKAANDKAKAIIDKITESSSVEIPNVMIEVRINQMLQRMELSLSQQGMTLDQYIGYTGTDISKLRENARADAQRTVKQDLVLEAIAKAEGLKAEDADISAEIAAMAATYQMTPAQVKKIVLENAQLPDIMDNIVRRKANAFVVENAIEVTE